LRVRKLMLKKKSLGIRLAVGVISVNLFIYLLVGVSIYRSRVQYERQAALTTQNLAHSLEITISDFLDKMNISLFAIKNEAERELAGGGITEKVLNAYITRENTVIPIFEEMWVADRNGNVRYGTNIPTDQTVNITDREYFQRLRANPEPGLIISKPVIGRITIPSTISIRVNVESESGLVLADPVQIQQVLTNLCTNAAHAMREKGGTLDIALSDFSVAPSNGDPHGIAPGLYMRLTVRDTGVGIPREIVDKIFDPFFTTKKVGEGTGLGLSVAMGIVKQSQGYITVESEPGRGSTFTVYFPKVAEKPIADAPVSDEPIPTGSERILFVDDETPLVLMGEALLAELGYEVTSRTSSREALDLLKQDPSRFDLVITDQTMPDVTGVELAREILAIRPELPVILCTGFSHLVDADSAKAVGIRAFVMKPLTKGEIARTMRKVLDG